MSKVMSLKMMLSGLRIIQRLTLRMKMNVAYIAWMMLPKEVNIDGIRNCFHARYPITQRKCKELAKISTNLGLR